MDLGRFFAFIILAPLAIAVRLGLITLVRRGRNPDTQPAKTPRWFYVVLGVGVLAGAVWVSLPK